MPATLSTLLAPPAVGRGSGAPLRVGVTSAIHDAMFHELMTVGLARMSMDAVARRAGVGKAALYRRWSSKDEMVVDLVFRALADSLPPFPDSIDLTTDVRSLLQYFRAQTRIPGFALIASDLLAESARDERLAQLIDEHVAEPRRRAAHHVLLAAVARGELPHDIDLELVTDLLIAPVAFRILILREPLDDARLDTLAAAICAALPAARRPAA